MTCGTGADRALAKSSVQGEPATAPGRRGGEGLTTRRSARGKGSGSRIVGADLTRTGNARVGNRPGHSPKH